MKTLILFTSKTGNTKAYAEDIGRQVSATVAPLKGFRAKKMLDYDTIVFGGWVQGGTIKGLDKFLSNYKSIEKKNVIVFSVGMSIPSSDARSLMIEQNLLDMYHVRYYQFRGSFDMKKLHFPENFMITNSLKMMANDPSTAPDQQALLTIKDHPIEFYDTEKVAKVVSVLNQLSFADAMASKEKA
jgi:menaquinone-dependent protoporphyrinogen IX oxidase